MTDNAVTKFVTQLRETQLLVPTQIDEVEQLQKSATRPAELASELVKRGWITPYQANQIARGRGGELVLGSYVILEPLAKGGMGQVFKARHRYMNRLVALKFIRQEQRDSADLVERFQREVQLLADLRHPHIVQAYDAGNIGNVWFMAMELLDGIDLEVWVRRQESLPIGQVCTCIRQAALGLHYAHGRGLVHRDIKPSNLFLTGEGIKLLDLGLARPQALSDESQAASLTRANSVMGTPDYLAPEQALDPRRAGAHSDIYSLGCTMYFLLAARPPFPDGSLAQKLLYHQQAEPTAIETLCSDVPAELAELLRQMLAKSPEQRPANAVAVAAKLAPLAKPLPATIPAAPQTDFHVNRPRTAAKAAASSSLVNAKAGAPERGFTLNTESMPPAPAISSLVNAKAETPEQGFTLVTESMPPTPASLVNAKSSAPESGFTLTTESAPSAAPTAAPAKSTTPGLPRGLVFLGLGVAGVLLMFVLVAALWMAGVFSSTPNGSASAQTKPEPKEKTPITPPDKNNAKIITPVKTKKNDPVNKPNPPVILQQNGPNEATDIPTKPFATDPLLRASAAGSKVFLNDMNEFAFKAGERGLRGKFTKNGMRLDEKEKITFAGKPSDKSIVMNTSSFGEYSRLCYALNRHAKSLHGNVRMELGRSRIGREMPLRFIIFGDGKLIWRSKAHDQPGEAEAFDLSVADVDALELRIYGDRRGLSPNEAVWLEPYLIRGP